MGFGFDVSGWLRLKCVGFKVSGLKVSWSGFRVLGFRIRGLRVYLDPTSR